MQSFHGSGSAISSRWVDFDDGCRRGSTPANTLSPTFSDTVNLLIFNECTPTVSRERHSGCLAQTHVDPGLAIGDE
jgi:hypothetical protein